MGIEMIRTAYKHRPRLGDRARPGRDRRREGQAPDRHHRSAVPGHQVAHRRGDRRSASRQAHHGHRRLDDECNRKGMRVVVELQRSGDAERRAQPALQAHPAADLVRLQHARARAGDDRDGKGRPLRSSRRCSRCARCSSTSSSHRKDVVTRRTRYELRKAEERAHLLEGFRIALDNIDESDRDHPRAATPSRPRAQGADGALHADRDPGQRDRRHAPAHAHRPRAPEDRGRVRRAGQADRRAARHPRRRRACAGSRRSSRAKPKTSRSASATSAAPRSSRWKTSSTIEDMIADTEVVVTSTVGGYIKRVSVDTFRAQNRGGRGVDRHRRTSSEKTSSRTSSWRRRTSTCCSSRTRAVRTGCAAYEIPDTTRQARGTALVNLLTLPPGESGDGRLPDPQVRRRPLPGDGHPARRHQEDASSKSSPTCAATASTRSGSTTATNCSRSISPTATRDIILATHDGMAVHFNETDVRPMGRNARGVRAITLAPGRQRSSRWTSSRTTGARC